MPSKPINTSHHTFNLPNSNQSTITSHHGKPSDMQTNSGQNDFYEENTSVSETLILTSHDVGLHSLKKADLQNPNQSIRLDLDPKDERKPLSQRISKYENPHVATHSKKNDGPEFEIIKKRYNSNLGPHLDKFPNGQDAAHKSQIGFLNELSQDSREKPQSDKRLFNRLTSLATWRGEYLIRTRLLRCLKRGKPARLPQKQDDNFSKSNSSAINSNPVVTYSSRLLAPINQIHSVFDTKTNTYSFIHGNSQSGTATISIPKYGKTDKWGLAEPHDLAQFNETWTGRQPSGLDDGPTVLPCSMDLSQPFGMVVGEGLPGGKVYFRCSNQMRGRYLSDAPVNADHEAGIPRIPKAVEGVSAVWIAKSHSVPNMSEGLIGMLIGSTLGVVTAHSLGTQNTLTKRIPQGLITLKWVLSPGIPIIRFDVDDSYDKNRKARGRIWAVALNALGEIFYLTQLPSSVLLERKIEENECGRYAWLTGRTAHWNLIESSRRVARDDTFHDLNIHASYSPRSSFKEMNLSKAQLVAETQEIEIFLQYTPTHFRKICNEWDMHQRLHVDFAGDDGNGAGEAIFVIKCGGSGGQETKIKRFTRWKNHIYLDPFPPLHTENINGLHQKFSPRPTKLSEPSFRDSVTPPGILAPRQVLKTLSDPSGDVRSIEDSEQWLSSLLSLRNHRSVEITSSGIDMSTYALVTVDEDPLLSNENNKGLGPSDFQHSLSLPGHRARFLVVGTNTGSLIIWNMRGPQSMNQTIVNEIYPLCTIHTDSPQISCLAVSALYIVHGGNDGLVQAWDPLASSLQPIRTINSRSSTQARRRLIQAESTISSPTVNMNSAGAILLDPDPTKLRGIVSLGTYLKFWEYSPSEADEFSCKKRRPRYSRGIESNVGAVRFISNCRGALKDFIDIEQDLQKEKLRKYSEDSRLRCRFGVGIGDLTEDEALIYAEMISAEEFANSKGKLMTESSSHENVDVRTLGEHSIGSNLKNNAQTTSSESSRYISDADFEQQTKEAIRLSLLEASNVSERDPVTFRVK